MNSTTTRTKTIESEKFTFIPLPVASRLMENSEYGFDEETLLHILDKWDVLFENHKDLLKPCIKSVKIFIQYKDKKSDDILDTDTIQIYDHYNFPIEVKEIYKSMSENVFNATKLKEKFGTLPKIVMG